MIKLLGCYILCGESLVEVNRLTIEFKGIDIKSKVEVVRLGKVEVKDINNNSKRPTDKRSTGEHVETE
jgi:hypothetical protein